MVWRCENDKRYPREVQTGENIGERENTDEKLLYSFATGVSSSESKEHPHGDVEGGIQIFININIDTKL